MNPKSKIQLYRRLLRQAEAQLRIAQLDPNTQTALNVIVQDDQLERRVFETLVDIAAEVNIWPDSDTGEYEYAEGAVVLGDELWDLANELPKVFRDVENLQSVEWYDLAQEYIEQHGEAATAKVLQTPEPRRMDWERYEQLHGRGSQHRYWER